MGRDPPARCRGRSAVAVGQHRDPSDVAAGRAVAAAPRARHILRMHLGTTRLDLRPFAPSDVDELLALFRAPSVRRYLLDDVVVGREWVRDEVVASRSRLREGSAGLWAVRERDAGAGDARSDRARPRRARPIVGFAGFRPFFEPPELQLLYGLRPSVWGRGYATEAAGAVLRFAYGELAFEEIRAATDVPDEASIRVLERLGFREVRRSEDGRHGTVFFRAGAAG